MNYFFNLLISALLACPSTSFVNQRNLVDDATEQLEELRSIVLGDIMVAHDNLDGFFSDFKVHTLGNNKGAFMDILQQAQTINNEIDSVVSLAEGAGYDVTTCTNTREENFDKLYDYHILEIANCLGEGDKRAVSVTDDAKYVVDISINTVDHFAAQLRRCGEELTCISPLLTEIQLNKIRMPQQIKTEVQAAESLLTTLKISFKSCADSNVAAFTTESYTLFEEIQSCVNKILG